MNQPRLLSRKPGRGLRTALSVIAGVVVATMGAAPAHALPDRASGTSGFSHQVSTIGTKPVGVPIAPAAQPSPGCDLEVTKSMSPMPLVSGQQATVTLTVKNVGTATCPGGILLQKTTVLTDNPLSGVTLTGRPVASRPGWVCSPPSGNATCSQLDPGLPPGYSATFTIPARVTGQGGTGLANCAQIANPADTNPDNNKSCVLLIIEEPKCDLEITKTMSPTPLVSGQPATVTLTVVNRGTGYCRTSIFDPPILSDSKQPGLTLTGKPVAKPPGGWTCSLSGGNATCTRPPLQFPLPPGYSATFTIPATVTAHPGTTVTNCAQITLADDTNPANNKSCVTKDVVSGCDLKITKTMSPTPLVSGQPAKVTLTVVNVGKGECAPGAFPGTGLRDNTPAGLTFTGQLMPNKPGWSCSLEVPSGNATCANQGTLPKGYTTTFTLAAKVTAQPGTTVTNCAEITNQNDTKTTNNKSCVTKQVT